MNVIPVENAKPIFSWCPEIEQGALDQMIALAKLPFVVHCALMPDGHLGMKDGAPIGSVIATENVVIPNAVGVDAGCGVTAIKSSLKKSEVLDVELRKKIHASVCRSIPMGFHHNDAKRVQELKDIYGDVIKKIFDETGVLENKHQVLKDSEKAFYEQCGTLGGGNHYCSLDYDENDDVWIQLHSGSRNIGKQLGDYFNRVACDCNKRWYSVDTCGIPFLSTEAEEGKSYLVWLNFALKFAFLNRQIMIDAMIKDIGYIINSKFDNSTRINIHHNYATQERHFGRNVFVHRKGAVEAREGTKGIIPGSMGTASFITVGLGNPQSLCSSSHGAGRTKGRTAFNVEMNTPEGLEQIKDSLEGIIYSDFGKVNRGRAEGMIDISESPAAYKDINMIMEQQKDLVKPIHKLMTMINWKDSGE